MTEHSHAHTHSHSHVHDKGCACDHGHAHDHHLFSVSQRWLVTGLLVVALLVLLRPFIISQMLVRETSYSANAEYGNAIRICQKIIALDHGNKQAWTALGFAYMDIGDTNGAVAAFGRVLHLDPQDHGAAGFELGEAYFSRGNYPRAIEYFEQVKGAGPRSAALLDIDMLKYRHGKLGFRSVNSMQTLLAHLAESYKQTGNLAQAAQVQKEYEIYKSKHSRILF